MFHLIARAQEVAGNQEEKSPFRSQRRSFDIRRNILFDKQRAVT